MNKRMVIALIGLSFLFAGCSGSSVNQTTSPTTTTNKVGKTEKMGTLTQVGKVYLLQNGTQSISLESYNLDLSQYVGKQVHVLGEYSGDTLFVTEVTEVTPQ